MRGAVGTLRPVVWFATASMWTTIVHETTHASVAYALGVPSTLYNYSVNLDMAPAHAASGDVLAIIAVSGPLVCLVFGALAWFAYRRARGSAAGLPLFYFAVFGVSTCFGNLMSAPFVGDCSTVTIALDLPMIIRQAMAVAGVLSVAAIHFWAGRQLADWILVVASVVLGTAIVILVNAPMPVTARLGEASFWIAGLAGAITVKQPTTVGPQLALRWYDGVAAVVAILMVRLMVRGIPFMP